MFIFITSYNINNLGLGTITEGTLGTYTLI